MKVSTDITRGDLIRFNLALMPRARSTHVMFTVLAVGYLIYFGLKRPQPDLTSWLILAAVSMLGAFAAIVVMTLIGIVMMLIVTKPGGGVLGRHDFELTPEGLHESTSVNVQLSRWSGIHSVQRVGTSLLVRVTPHLAHVLPRRAFASEADFNEFVAKAASYFKAARSSAPSAP